MAMLNEMMVIAAVSRQTQNPNVAAVTRAESTGENA